MIFSRQTPISKNSRSNSGKYRRWRGLILPLLHWTEHAHVQDQTAYTIRSIRVMNMTYIPLFSAESWRVLICVWDADGCWGGIGWAPHDNTWSRFPSASDQVHVRDINGFGLQQSTLTDERDIRSVGYYRPPQVRQISLEAKMARYGNPFRPRTISPAIICWS